MEKYMRFSINNNLRFIESFQFLSSSLDSLIKKLLRYFILKYSSVLVKNWIITY